MEKQAKIIKSKQGVYLLIYIAFYFVVNCFFLVNFPIMHSDESWLSGLTRTMMHEGLGATEYFFDILPRYPHAIKSVFHILQMPFILIFGYNLFAVRLMSLIFGILSLVLIYKILLKLTESKLISMGGMIIVSLDIQFIYASHFARQEIIILFLMLLAIYHIIANVENWTIKDDIIAGIIVGVGVGIHPNSFIAALVVGSVYLYYLLIERKLKIKNLIILILIVAVCAGVFVGFSYMMNDNFLNDYLKYGDNLGATQSGIMKIFAFPDYYRKLFNGFSVTYYLPDIRLQFVVFGIWMAFCIIYSVFSKRKTVLLMILPVIAINIGILAIGRYSQPSIVFIFPFCYMMMFVLIKRVKKRQMLDMICIGLAVLISTIIQVATNINNDYDEYLAEIKAIVPSDAQVLANLNAEYAFDYDKLHDYRNLDKLDRGGFEEYIRENEIEYIVYPEEMEYIYDNRPVWNVVYGNVFPYYDDMQMFFEEECELESSFTSPFAMRILMFSNEKEWEVKIYKVMEMDND